MRRYIFILVFALSSGFVNAQDWGSGILINAGTSLGTYNWGLGNAYSRSGFSLPLLASVEFGVAEDISVGPWVGFHSQRYNYNNGYGTYKYSYTTLTFGGKGTYHATNLINEELDAGIDDNIDIYGSLYIGAIMRNEDIGDGLIVGGVGNSVGVNVGAAVGLRYMFTPAIGVFAETGRGIMGWFTGGLSLKL